jgi:ribosome-associated protein
MDIKKLQTAVVDALEDVKAQDIKIYDTTHLTSLFDRVAIASGTSNRQTKALAASVRDKIKAKGGHVVSVEGEDTGEWVLVDLGDMIVHIMQPAIRAYYRLEEIWGDKEVKMGAAKRVASSAAAKKAGEDEKPAKIRRTREQAEAVEASQAIDDDEAPKKPARKPRTTSVSSDAKPAPKTTRAPRASTTLSAAKTKAAAAAAGTPVKRKAPTKKAVGTTVKVAMPKSAVASKKAAAAKRPARPKAKA